MVTCYILQRQEVCTTFHLSLLCTALLGTDPVAFSLCEHIVHAALPANTFAIYGTGQVKELTELVPGILNQLGPDSLASLRKLAESYQAYQGQRKPPGMSGKDEDDDDDVPDLVENFEVGEKEEKLEDVN